MDIRTPNEEELLDCVNILLQGFNRPVNENAIQSLGKVWQDLSKKQITKFVLVEHEGNILGTGGVTFQENVSCMGFMRVLPKFQRQGVGRNIFQELLQISEKRKIKTLELFATKAGEDLYRQFGFQLDYPAQVCEIQGKPDYKPTQDVEISDDLPPWTIKLDKKAYGYNRARYLKFLSERGGKVLIIENQAYGVILNNKIGPLIANNIDNAIDIIYEGIALNCNRIIIPLHEKLEKMIFQKLNLSEIQGTKCMKMQYGSSISGNTELIFAINSFATG